MNAGGGPFAGPLRCSAINHSTCARRASSEHCRVQSGVEERSAVCRVGHACRVGTNKSKQVDNKPLAGARALLGLGRLGSGRRPYNSTCSRRRIQSNVALLNPASQHTTKRRRKTLGRRGSIGPGPPTGRPEREPRPSSSHATSHDAIRRPSEISNKAWRRMRTALRHSTGSMHRPPRQFALTARAVAADPRHVKARRSGGPRRERGPCDPGPRPELELDTRASPHVQQEHCKK